MPKTPAKKDQSLFEKDIPKMPEGYYSGDKPNPNLRAFVEEHVKEKPYDPEKDEYNVEAFNEPIKTTKATAIYNMHTYWSKKPHDAIQQYIRHYTEPGNLVLDPFCGSGSTALAALMEGRKAIAIDRSPAATFITKNYCTPVDPDELEEAFEELKEKVKPEIDWLYETRCDRCGGKATTSYTVYSQVFQCPRCLEKVPFFDCVDAESETAKGKPKKIKVCPFCHEKGIFEEISTRSERFGSTPVLVSYICEAGCKPKRAERRQNDPDPKKREYFQKYDLGKIKEIEEKEVPYWYPTDRMMHAPEDQRRWGEEWRPGRDFRTVDELFTKRNLWALALILGSLEEPAAGTSDVMRFTASAFLLNASKLYRYRETGGGQPTGNYYMPQISKENETWLAYERKWDDIHEAINAVSLALQCYKVIISTQDTRRLLELLTSSVDYIFTDPPYAGNVQYGELNFIWEAWLGFDTHWHDEEIIVNEVRGKTEADWAEMMKQAMGECYRVLKPGRWLSLCYHDTSEGTWSLVQDIMAEVGFVVDKTNEALFIDTNQKTYNQRMAEKVAKRDLVINFRKPKPGEIAYEITITGEEDTSTFNEKVHAIITDYLTSNPGSTKDRVYDEVVSRMVRAGTMEPHNFERLLSEVAEEVKEPVKKDLFEDKAPDLMGTHEVGRWYLKETSLALVDEAESAKEDAAAAVLREFISQALEENPEFDGVHYSDLFEHYVYTVSDKPRRQLTEWLPDYFYKTESGTYRLPQSEEEEKLKAEGRKKGTSRKIRRFVSYLERGLPIPEDERPSDADLAGWIRHCKRTGLFTQGKLLYEKGGLDMDALSEEAQAYVDEDYESCMRALGRG